MGAATFSRFTTVAATGDSAMLPTAAAGLCYTVKNAGANSMNMFPNTTPALGVVAGGDQINLGGANVAFALASGKAAQFFCAANGFWDVILSA
jgi:hypothetical protein